MGHRFGQWRAVPVGLPMKKDAPGMRLSILGIVVVALFASLSARLWYLQVMATDEFQVVAQANRVRVVPVEAPRGRILDVTGKVLVDNAISVQVTIDRTVLEKLEKDERATVLASLAEALSRASKAKTVADIETDLANQRYSPYVPVPVASDVPEDLKIWLDERAAEFPGVSAVRVAVRHYPYGSLGAHVLGYTGQINDTEFEGVADSDKPYTLNDEIGKSGLELQYESYLRGTPGTREIEVDAANEPIRDIGGDPPIPGDDVVLNLNIDVQAQAEQALKTGLTFAQRRACAGCKGAVVAEVGSTVVLDARTGAVVAMASYPTYNPADFIDGISDSEFAYLDDPANFSPQNNYAIQGQYAPGSTFKPFTAEAGLSAGILTPQTTINDSGSFAVPGCTGDSCIFRNDNGKAYGSVNLSRSLTVSSDVFFYGLGARFWREQDALGGPEVFRSLLERWGFSKDTGIDLPYEQSGRIPSPQWLTKFCQEVDCLEDTWRTGDNVNMAVGQGSVLLTPLQIAGAYAAIGNGGIVWTPYMVKQILDGVTGEVIKTIEPKELSRVELLPEWRAAIVDGLQGVTTGEGGTATGAFSGFNSVAYPVAAKTGTAQVGSKKAPNAVFGSFAPAGNPQYAISVLLQEAGYGGTTAAPVARRLYDVLSGSIPLTPAPLGGKFDDLTTLAPEPGDVRD